MNDPSPLDAIREQTGKIEDFLDTLSDPVKPYVKSSNAHETPPLKLYSEDYVALHNSFFRVYADVVNLADICRPLGVS